MNHNQVTFWVFIIFSASSSKLGSIILCFLLNLFQLLENVILSFKILLKSQGIKSNSGYFFCTVDLTLNLK